MRRLSTLISALLITTSLANAQSIVIGRPNPGAAPAPPAQYPGTQYPGAQYPGTQYPGKPSPNSPYPNSPYPTPQPVASTPVTGKPVAPGTSTAAPTTSTQESGGSATTDAQKKEEERKKQEAGGIWAQLQKIFKEDKDFAEFVGLGMGKIYKSIFIGVNSSYLALELTVTGVGKACPGNQQVIDQWRERNRPIAGKAYLVLLVWYPVSQTLDPAATATALFQLGTFWPATAQNIATATDALRANPQFGCPKEIAKIRNGQQDVQTNYPGLVKQVNMLLSPFPKSMVDAQQSNVASGIKLGSTADLPKSDSSNWNDKNQPTTKPK